MANLKDYYSGTRAKKYQAARDKDPRWEREQTLVSNFLSRVATGLRVIDVPIGTARFAPIYKKLGCSVIGCDISPDMLAEAKLKAAEAGLDAKFRIENATSLSFDTDSTDIAVCVRLLNLIDISQVRSVVSELARVSSKYVILDVRLTKEEPWLSWSKLSNSIARTRGRLKRRPIYVHDPDVWSDILSKSNLGVVERALIDDTRYGGSQFLYLLKTN